MTGCAPAVVQRARERRGVRLRAVRARAGVAQGAARGAQGARELLALGRAQRERGLQVRDLARQHRARRVRARAADVGRLVVEERVRQVVRAASALLPTQKGIR